MTGVTVSYYDLIAAASLLSINAVISILLSLGLARSLLMAAARMTVQLLIVGLVLKFLFASGSAWLTLAMGVVMIAAAGYEVMQRQERRLAGLWGYGLGTLSILIAASAITIFGLAALLQPDPWHAPRYAVPVLGMILGNAMTGVSLGLSTLITAADRERPAIEARLLLGQSRWQAMNGVMRRAVRDGFMPIINAMAATGLIALPGMMTGQILAGADPQTAVFYQLLIMFLIAASTGIGVLLIVVAATWRITDERHRLRLDRLRQP